MSRSHSEDMDTNRILKNSYRKSNKIVLDGRSTTEYLGCIFPYKMIVKFPCGTDEYYDIFPS